MKLKAIVEIPMGSKYKYEFDKKNNNLLLDRVLNQRIPSNYGYFSETLFDDGDPLDVFIISTDPIPSLTEVEVEICGAIKCNDNGVQDDKLWGYLMGEEKKLEFKEKEMAIEHYLRTYKEGFIVESFENEETALEIYNYSVKKFKELQ
jgi:inorganic pyrophosphatase